MNRSENAVFHQCLAEVKEVAETFSCQFEVSLDLLVVYRHRFFSGLEFNNHFVFEVGCGAVLGL